MKYEKTVTLKTGEKCVLRNGMESDAAEVLDCFNVTHGETDFLLSYPDENTFDLEKEREYLAQKEASGREIEICAVVDGHVAGTAGIGAVGERDKVKHRADFGIGIKKDYWGRGIGRALTEACVECACQAGYVQLELEAVGENESALALYKSAGFVEYGRNPKGFRSRSGRWQEVVLMRMEL